MHADVLNMHILNSVACLPTIFTTSIIFHWTCFGKIASTIVGTENTTTNPAILGLNHLTYFDTITSVLHNFKKIAMHKILQS